MKSFLFIKRRNEERITKDPMCIYDGQTVRCSVNNSFLSSSKVNSYVHTLSLVFNSDSQLFIAISLLVTTEHFRVDNTFSYCLFHEGIGIFQCAPNCSNYRTTLHTFSLSDYNLHFSWVNYTLSFHRFPSPTPP